MGWTRYTILLPLYTLALSVPSAYDDLFSISTPSDSYTSFTAPLDGKASENPPQPSQVAVDSPQCWLPPSFLCLSQWLKVSSTLTAHHWASRKKPALCVPAWLCGLGPRMWALYPEANPSACCWVSLAHLLNTLGCTSGSSTEIGHTIILPQSIATKVIELTLVRYLGPFHT